LQPLSELSCLLELDISGDDDADEPINDYLRPLAGMLELQRLDLSFNERVGSDSFRYINGLTRLAFLDISNTVIKVDDDLQHLRTLQNLRELHVRHTEISGSGLQYLSSLSHLRNLELCHSAVTDEGLEEGLRGWATRLEYIKLEGCKLSDSYVASLKVALPNTEISGLQVTWESVFRL
jgi:hypothetical protein